MNRSRPVVGATSYTPPGGDGKTYSLPREYVDSLEAAGLEIVLLPPTTGIGVLGRLDGLVLSGGGDLDASLYGGEPHEACYMVDRERDDFEMRLVEFVLGSAMPLFAICRGMQILNVHLGGSLIPHVPERYGDRVVHRAPPREPVLHQVMLAGTSRLRGIVGEGALDVMSWHHQAVDRLGAGLTVTAHSADGLIEAVEPDGSAWVVGVQWHPELNAVTDPRQAALFESFAAAAATYGRQR